mgnify:CR=1 FL=1
MIYDLNLEGNPDINIRPLFENWIKRYENSNIEINLDKVIDTSIRCTDPEDEVLLLRLNLYGEMPDEIE